MTTRYAVAIAAALILAACGGGGGGSPVSNDAQPTTPAPSTPDRSSAYTADQGQNLSGARRAAVAQPAFGSVTQSSNTNIAGVTTDAAQVRFEGNTFFLTVRRQDGSTLALNSRDHLQEVETDLESPYVYGRSFDHGYLARIDANSATVMYGAVEYAAGDYNFLGDWMAGGYWLHVRGDAQAGAVTAVEVGAFVDGPEISGPANLPLSGTATYNGFAGGLAFTRTGNDAWLARNGIPAGVYELFEYAGDFRAVADFGAGTIEASISNIDGYGWQEFPDGTLLEGEGSTPGTMYFGPTSINADGSWTGTALSFTDPRYTVSSVEGSWGGRFSNTADSAGEPRLASGTHGGRIVTTGGTESVFVGSHHGVTDNY